MVLGLAVVVLASCGTKEAPPEKSASASPVPVGGDRLTLHIPGMRDKLKLT